MYFDPQSVQVFNPQQPPVKKQAHADDMPSRMAAPVIPNSPLIVVDPSVIPVGQNPVVVPTMQVPTENPMDYGDAGMQQAMRQAFGGAVGPEIPIEYQKRIDQIRKLIEPGDLANKYISETRAAANIPEQHGLKARLAGAGKRLLMGEGLAGLVRGLSDPTTASMQYRMAKNAPLGQAAQIEQGFNNDTLSRSAKLAEITGVDPITGTETPAAVYKKALADAAARKVGVQEENAKTAKTRVDAYGRQVDNKILMDQAKVDIQRLNATLAGRKQGGVLTADEQEAIAENFGIRLPANFDPQLKEVKLGANGQFVIIDKARNTVTDTGVTSYEPQKEKNKETRAEIISNRPQRPTPSTEISRERLEIDRAEAERKLQKDAHEQALKEYPQPKGRLGQPPKPEVIDQWKKDVERRTQEIYNKMPKIPQSGANQSGAPVNNAQRNFQSLNQTFKKSLPEGAEIINFEVSPSTGRKRYRVRLKDGSETYMYPK